MSAELESREGLFAGVWLEDLAPDSALLQPFHAWMPNVETGCEPR